MTCLKDQTLSGLRLADETIEAHLRGHGQQDEHISDGKLTNRRSYLANRTARGPIVSVFDDLPHRC